MRERLRERQREKERDRSGEKLSCPLWGVGWVKKGMKSTINDTMVYYVF